MTQIYTVQYQQFFVTDVEDFKSYAEACERYAELCADPDTTLAWLFDGPGETAECLDEYIKPEGER